jgi:hypothetical protein
VRHLSGSDLKVAGEKESGDLSERSKEENEYPSEGTVPREFNDGNPLGATPAKADESNKRTEFDKAN